MAYTCDLTDATQVENLYKEVCGGGSTITVLINNAGVVASNTLTEISLTQIKLTIDVNLIANLWMIKLFLPEMLKLNTGHIVNIASAAGFDPTLPITDYCASKAASMHTMSQLRVQTTGSNVKYTAVCPFIVKTEMAPK